MVRPASPTAAEPAGPCADAVDVGDGSGDVDDVGRRLDGDADGDGDGGDGAADGDGADGEDGAGLLGRVTVSSPPQALRVRASRAAPASGAPGVRRNTR
jgi:hypothetical protein